MTLPRVIAVTGPTASGKTALAVELARALDTEIISVDSRQFYRELPIGSAMPDEAQLRAVKHHFIACRSVTDEYAAGTFARDARRVIEGLSAHKKHVVVCGGSGLYLQALLFGMDDFPEVTEAAKIRVETLYKEQGLPGLQQALQQADPVYAQTVDLQNPARLRRALEVCFSGDRPYSAYRTESKNAELPFVAYGLDVPKPELHRRIHARVDHMLEAGLEKEARRVYPLRRLKALQTVGYQEFFDYFDGKISYAACVELIKTHTRQYAKRQLTWFRRQLDVTWLPPENALETILRDSTGA